MAQVDDFTDAFNGADEQKETQTEDQVFGLEEEVTEESQAMPEEAAEMGSEDAETASEGAAGDDAEGNAPAVVIAVEPASEADPEMPTDPKELQRMKSWEGRLKAREAELKAREEAVGKTTEPMEPEESAAVEAAEPGVTEAVEDAVEAVQNGEMSIEQAMSGLADTFGEDFTKMLGVLIEKKASEIAGKTADDRFGRVRGEIDGLASEIVADKANSHYESIADAHPDFMDVAGSPEFKSYVDGLDPTMQAKAAKVIQSGSAKQIVRLLDDYKKTLNKVDAPKEDPAMDAAEGVRSKGLKIPEKPSESQDFAEAWNSF